MTSRERLEKAWAFEQPDRLPIELQVHPSVREMPEARRLVDFEHDEADNLYHGGPGFDWGFFGLDATYRESTIEDIPGSYYRKRRTYSTPVGEFDAVSRHKYHGVSAVDFHWQKRFIESIDDLVRHSEAPRRARKFDTEAYLTALGDLGDRGVLMTPLFHPLGELTRRANLESVYIWLATESKTIHRFIESCTQCITDSIDGLPHRVSCEKPVFKTSAYETLIPPWMGRRMFNELVVPYDSEVNGAVHRMGGRIRAHAHGSTGEYLESLAAIGIDSLEPLEPPPYGDNDLCEAKRRVGDRMLLSGNVVAQDFLFLTDAEIKEMVQRAVACGAPGGGYTLRCTNTYCGTADGTSEEQNRAILHKLNVYLDAALEYADCYR